MTNDDDLADLARTLAGFTPRPPTITTVAEQHRWELCLEIAGKAGEFYEPTGVADPMFVAFAARGLYDSDIPTDDPTDAHQIAASWQAPYKKVFGVAPTG